MPDHGNAPSPAAEPPRFVFHDDEYFKQRLEAGVVPAYKHGAVAGLIASAASFGACKASKLSLYATGVLTILSGLCFSNFMVHYSYQMHRDRVMFERRMEASIRADEQRRR